MVWAIIWLASTVGLFSAVVANEEHAVRGGLAVALLLPFYVSGAVLALNAL